MHDSIDEKAKQFAEELFPLRPHVNVWQVAEMAYKAGHAAGYAEASDRDFGSGFRDGLLSND